ncbi:hypothetical protein ACFFL1_10985 [Samsonia erythrinae]|uniref:Uncharacterized protein n=2 Tax=Samsonia erythrinae TaxID=160434 RepID=A0A4R3VPS9_9GAMM|nr:hypothetical protein [Samsonia erythrinae]TCV06348.1 hypothetical protein EDC54_104257 [Samsonia erythrinae]
MEGISYCYMQACDKTLQKKEVFNQVLKKALKENAYPLSADTWNIETLNEVNVIATTISGINVLAVKADFFKANINGDLKQITALLTRQDRLFVDTGGKSTRQISCGGQRLKRRYCLKV